jgi:hypothetical protein
MTPQTGVTDMADVADIADVAGPLGHPTTPLGGPENRPKTLFNQSLTLWATQDDFLKSIHEVKFFEGEKELLSTST